MEQCERPLDNFMAALEKSAFENMIPLKGTFELTARCNFRCPMCYVHLSPEQVSSMGRELTASEWLDIAKQAKDAGMLYLTLTGGEVFVRKDFREIYEGLSEMGFLIQIFTNGYLLNDEILGWLKKRPPYIMRFTMYGAGNETYRHFCGTDDGYDRYVNAVRMLREAKIPLYMVSTITKENVHEFEDIVKFAYMNRLAFTHTTNLLPAVRGASQDPVSHRISIDDMTGEELEALRKKLAEDEKNYCEKPYLERCGNYRRGFYITWDGRMTLCSFMDKPSVSVTENGFSKSWQELNGLVSMIKEPEKCKNCKAYRQCTKCPGELSAVCGSWDCATDEFCARAHRDYGILHNDHSE